MENQTVKEGKTMAIISYITIIGTIIAFAMNNDKRNSYASFHVKQALGINLFSFVNILVIAPYGSLWAAQLISFLIFVLWIIGLVAAIQGEERTVPVVGDLFQDWFKNFA